jgi:hypothetical protein
VYALCPASYHPSSLDFNQHTRPKLNFSPAHHTHRSTCSCSSWTQSPRPHRAAWAEQRNQTMLAHPFDLEPTIYNPDEQQRAHLRPRTTQPCSARTRTPWPCLSTCARTRVQLPFQDASYLSRTRSARPLMTPASERQQLATRSVPATSASAWHFVKRSLRGGPPSLSRPFPRGASIPKT